MSVASVARSSMKSTTSEWTKIFPAQATETYTSSATFMKQLTSVAVSMITYLKNLFSPDNYNEEKFAGLQLRILKTKCTDDLAQFISTALIHAFEAMEKKYLHKLAICFYDGDRQINNLIEYYVFEYSYEDSGVTMNLRSKGGVSVQRSQALQDVRLQTSALLTACKEAIKVNSSFDLIPDSCDISVQLYYNDAAPAGYQAPGYSGASVCPLPAGASQASLGAVRTPFHSLRASACFMLDLAASNNATASENNPSLMQDDNFENIAPNLLSWSAERQGEAPQVLCPCKRDCADGDRLLICIHCGTWQHLVCFGLRRTPAAHCCLRCYDQQPRRTPSDPRLCALPDNKRKLSLRASSHSRPSVLTILDRIISYQQSLCLFRRILWRCEAGGSRAVSARSLAAAYCLPRTSALRLLDMLATHGIVAAGHSHPDEPHEIILEQVKRTIDNFFEPELPSDASSVGRAAEGSTEVPPEEPPVVARVLTACAAPPARDPLAEILDPATRADLHNSLGYKVLPSQPAPKVQVDSPTLDQYRSAFQATVDDAVELPLSGSRKSTKRKTLDDAPQSSGIKSKRTKKSGSRPG